MVGVRRGGEWWESGGVVSGGSRRGGEWWESGWGGE